MGFSLLALLEPRRLESGYVRGPERYMSFLRQVFADDEHSLREFLMTKVKELTGNWPEAPGLSFTDLGLDSLTINSLVDSIRDRRKLSAKDLDETVLYDDKHSTIDGLVSYCLQIQAREQEVVRPVGPVGPVGPVAPLKAPQQSSFCCIRAVASEYPQRIFEMQALSHFLISGQDAVSEIPRARWDVDEYYSEKTQPGYMYTRHGSFISRDPLAFDETHFGLTPKEVSYMDPQQRLALETAEKTMLGVTLAERDIGVFVGVMTHDFSDQLCVQQVRVKPVLFGLCVCVNMGLYQPNGSKCNLSREHDDQSVDLPTVFNQTHV